MKYTKESLSKYNVHYLRSLGRSMGVKSPTTLNKKTLIEKIMEIENGKVKPEFSKVGKPPLKFLDINNFGESDKSGTLRLKKIKNLCNKLIKEIEILLKT